MYYSHGGSRWGFDSCAEDSEAEHMSAYIGLVFFFDLFGAALYGQSAVII